MIIAKKNLEIKVFVTFAKCILEKKVHELIVTHKKAIELNVLQRKTWQHLFRMVARRATFAKRMMEQYMLKPIELIFDQSHFKNFFEAVCNKIVMEF